MNKIVGVLALSVVLLGSFATPAHAADVVTTYKDDNGWKLQVNGQDFYAKGVVWSYSPRGQNYSYNLWGESDVLRGMARHWRDSGSGADLPTPYGPDSDLVGASDVSTGDRS